MDCLRPSGVIAVLDATVKTQSNTIIVAPKSEWQKTSGNATIRQSALNTVVRGRRNALPEEAKMTEGIEVKSNPNRVLPFHKRTGLAWSGRRPPYPPFDPLSRTWRWMRSKLKTLRTHRTG